MERFNAKIESLASNDPWWCHLNTEEGIRNFFPDLPHDIRCVTRPPADGKEHVLAASRLDPPLWPHACCPPPSS